MSEHRYPVAALLPDYARGVLGIVLCGGAWLLAPTAPIAVAIFGGLTVLFLVFTMRNVWRQGMRVTLSDDALAVGGFRSRTLAWRDLSGLRLRYYATRRNRQGGWMTLQLRSAGARVTLDSTLEGFAQVIDKATQEARRNGVDLDAVTLANLAALERAQRSPQEGDEA